MSFEIHSINSSGIYWVTFVYGRIRLEEFPGIINVSVNITN